MLLPGVLGAGHLCSGRAIWGGTQGAGGGEVPLGNVGCERAGGRREADEDFCLGHATSQVSSATGLELGNQRCSLAVDFKELAGLESLQFSQVLQTIHLMILSKMSSEVNVTITRFPYIRISEWDPEHSTLFLTGVLNRSGVIVIMSKHWPWELSGGWGIKRGAPTEQRRGVLP